MTICLINLAFLDPPNNGGVHHIAREILLALLEESPPDFHLVCVVHVKALRKFRTWLGWRDHLTVLPYHRLIPARVLLELVRPDLIVSPLFGAAPFTRYGNRPHVIALPDTLVFDHPELFAPSEVKARRRMYAGQENSIVVTLSEFARSRLAFHYPELQRRIVIIPPGADREVLAPDAPLVNPPYVFYPANTWRHKRHDLLLQAMSIVWQRRPELKLVLTGGRPHYIDLSALIARWAPPNAVVDLGYVTDEQMSSLYTYAEALVFASNYEGFGIPLIEAMRMGCPILCTPTTAIPEVIGDAALYVSEDSPEAWANALLERLPAERSQLIQRGYDRAASFTWAKTRDLWLKIIFETASQKRAGD